MTLFATIKLILIAVAFLTVGGGILFLKTRLKKGDAAIKQNKTFKKQKQNTVELNQEKKDVELQIGDIEEDLDNIDGDELSSNYNDKLPDKPVRRRSRDK